MRPRPPAAPARFVPDPREQEAYDEMARTRIGTPTAVLLLVGFLALLLTGPALELLALRRGDSEVYRPLAAPERPGIAAALDALRGSIAELELRFDERSRLVRLVRPPSQAALVRWARYGNESAYVGRDGWLVFRPDFDHLALAVRDTDRVEAVRRAVLDLRDGLARRGVALLLLPAPVKPAVHPESLAVSRHLPRDREPPRPATERELLDRLAADGVALLDPLPRLALAAASDRRVYLAGDTHWRPEAVDDVARDLAIALRAAADLPAGDGGRWREEAATVEGTGDTAALLDLPARFPRPWTERVETRRVVGADGATWRPLRGAPVLLLGDSFSAVYSQAELGWGTGAGLAERLSWHLGRPVDRIVRNAGGATAAREALAAALTAEPDRLDGVRVVVWEFAARELTQGDWRPVALP